jgi:hypothetical protein
MVPLTTLGKTPSLTLLAAGAHQQFVVFSADHHSNHISVSPCVSSHDFPTGLHLQCLPEVMCCQPVVLLVLLGGGRNIRRWGLMGGSEVTVDVPLKRMLRLHPLPCLASQLPSHDVLCCHRPIATGPSHHGLEPYKLIFTNICYSSKKLTNTFFMVSESRVPLFIRTQVVLDYSPAVSMSMISL